LNKSKSLMIKICNILWTIYGFYNV
jgi:uncharacterized membrane protein YpjA